MSVVRHNIEAYTEAVNFAREHENARLEVYDSVFGKYLDFLVATEELKVPRSEDYRDFENAIGGSCSMSGKEFEQSVRDGSAGSLSVEKYLPLMLRDCLDKGKKEFNDVNTIVDALGNECLYDGKHRAFIRGDYGYFVLDKDTAQLQKIVFHLRQILPGTVVNAPSGAGLKPRNDPAFSMYVAKFFPSVAYLLHDMGKLKMPAPSLAERNSVSPLQYDKATLDYRNSIVNVFRFAAKLAKPEGEGRFLPLNIPGIKGAEGLCFTSAGSSTAVSLRFEDGSVLRSSHISTMDLKEIKRGLDSFIAMEKMKRNHGKGKDHDKGKGI